MMRFNLHSTPVRLALTYMAIFAISVLVLGVTTYATVQNSLDQQLRLHIQNELDQLLIDYNEEGLDELRHDIAENIESATSHRMHYTLVSPTGRTIFDRIPEIPAQQGWHYITASKDKKLLIYRYDLNDNYILLIGDDLDGLSALQNVLRNKFIIALVMTLLIGIVGSIIISRHFIARISRFEAAAKNIGHGALAERLPLSGSGDTFDGLAVTINTMLDRIEQLISQIKHVSSNIAHDMRTPLGRIRLRLEEMHVSLADHPDQQQACQETIDMLDESLEIFASILRISQIESGAQRSGFKSFDLSHRFQEIAEAFRPVAEDNGITLSTGIASDIQIKGDETLVSQALVNLIENALTHAKGATSIDLHMHREKNDIVIICADNGIGVPQDKHALLTQAFFRMDDSRSTKGNGLGLHLVDAIVKLHDGRMDFSDNNPGLKITLRLPA